jgi:predicted transcriptional regulator
MTDSPQNDACLRDFLSRWRREHDAYVREKVEAGREDVRAGRVSEHDEVEAAFAARRAELLRRAGS